MYANGVRVIDMPLLERDGYLKHAQFVPPEFRQVSANGDNKLKVGQYVYQMQCRYCHTVNGINAITARVKGWNEETIDNRISALHANVTPFMPPFAGNVAERQALSAYLYDLSSQQR
jgi:mono/diheme cytochrome c family protein